MTESKAIRKPRRQASVSARLRARGFDTLQFAEIADALRQEKRLGEAQEICSDGLARYPHYASGHVVMGRILGDRGLTEEAEQEWREALRLDPGHPQAHLCLAEFYLSCNADSRAVAALEALLLLNPDLPEATAMLSQVRTRRTREDEIKIPSSYPASQHLTPAENDLPKASLDHLLSLLASCRSIESAVVADDEELKLTGILAQSGSHASVALIVELMQEIARVVERLGVGKMRHALLKGKGGGLYGTARNGLTILATTASRTDIAIVNAEIDQTTKKWQQTISGETQPYG